MDDIELQFTDGALDFVVEKALEYKLGARGLRSLCEAILTEPMFELPGTETKDFKVDKSFAMSRLNKVAVKKLKAVS